MIAIEMFCHFSNKITLVGTSPCCLVLRLAIAVVDQSKCPNAEQLRMHIKIYKFLRNSRQIKLPLMPMGHKLQGLI